MRFRRRNIPAVELEPQIDPAVELEMRAANAVLGFRHRLDTDSEFRHTFGDAIKEALARSEASSAEESKKHAQEYFGSKALGRDLTERAHAAKGEIFNGVLNLLTWAVQSEDLDSTSFISELRRHIGINVNQAFEEGLLQPDPQFFMPGTIGVDNDELGMIVVVDRVVEAGIDITKLARGGK